MSTAGSGGSGGSEGITGNLPFEGTPTALWDYTGIIGTGQSLSVGAQAGAIRAAAMAQPYNNLKLSLGTATVPPFNSDDAALSLVPLVEPIRPIGQGYPSPYPVNLDGESPHTAMSAQITKLAKDGGLADLVTVHTVVGESGQPMSVINKTAVEMPSGTGIIGRAYAASLFEARAIKRLAGDKSYGIGAIFLTHGESDAGNPNYVNDMLTLWTDYNADLKVITGQTQDIPLFTSQQHGIFMYAPGQAPRNIDPSTLLQWRAGLDQPGKIVCTGPKYQYPYDADWLHMTPLGYELMGEKYAEVFYSHVVLGKPWSPLQPLAQTVARAGRVITVDFQVPVLPLAWDDALPKPHQADRTEWAQGRGFEVRMGATPLQIESVELSDEDTVQITLAADVPAGATLGYAASSDAAAISGTSPRWGQLKDSDPFVGAFTQMPQANYAVSFELPVQ
ncbi:MAG: hypothetical protein RL685_1843 [Pseudomonadota bacterium]|jgi:hypothetical protein